MGGGEGGESLFGYLVSPEWECFRLLYLFFSQLKMFCALVIQTLLAARNKLERHVCALSVLSRSRNLSDVI